MIDFVAFPKIARLSRECTITEKIDGTNAQVFIHPMPSKEFPSSAADEFEFGLDTQIEVDGVPALIRAGSRSRWLGMSGKDDNFGFGQWVYQHAHELATLGFGNHFGEWWGSGIQRGYGLTRGEKRFSLFNTHRWTDDTMRPACCHVVPILHSGTFDTEHAEYLVAVYLKQHGSRAAPGFMNPEGIIIYHHAAGLYFKKTLDKDEEWKGKAA